MVVFSSILWVLILLKITLLYYLIIHFSLTVGLEVVINKRLVSIIISYDIGEG